MSLQIRSWFFTVTKTAIKRGLRFKNGDRPEEPTFVSLLDSVVMKTETGDRAKEDSGANVNTLNGHVVASTDAQAKAFQAKKTDRTLAAQPSQLPESAIDADQTIDDYVGNTIDVTVDGTVSTRNKYLLKISDAFLTWLEARLASVGVTFATGSQIFNATDVDAAVKPNQLPVVQQYTDDAILGFNDKTIEVFLDNVGENKYYSLGLTTQFKDFLEGALTPVSVNAVYVSPNGSDTTGTGSITNPYQTIGKGVDVSIALGLAFTQPVVVLGGNYTVVAGIAPFNNVIDFAPGAIVTWTPTNADTFLFTASSASFSITGLGRFTTTNAGTFFLDTSSFTVGTVRAACRSISAVDSLFKLGGTSSTILLENAQVTFNTARNIFVGAENIADTSSYVLPVNLSGGGFKFNNCDISRGFIAVTNINFNTTSLIRNSTMYGSLYYSTMPYAVLGSFANTSAYSCIIDNVNFDNAGRAPASSCIQLLDTTANLVMRNVVFDRGAIINGAFSVSAVSPVNIRAAQTLDTLGGSVVYLFKHAIVAPVQTIASDTLVCDNDHELIVGDQIFVLDSTVTGLAALSTFYVKTIPTSNTFTVSASSGGATASISGTGVYAVLNIARATHNGLSNVTNSIIGGINNIHNQALNTTLFNFSLQ